MKIYADDFETSKEKDEAWVYLTCSRPIENPIYDVKRDINGYMTERLEGDYDECEFVFFNLHFDCSYIVNWLLRQNAIQLVDSANYYFNKSIKDLGVELGEYEEKFKSIIKKNKDDKLYFKVGINGLGVWYRVDVWYKQKYMVFTDACKLFPGMTLEEVGEQFLGYEKAKLDYDYDKIRYPDTVLEDHDYEYIKRDTDILAEALYKLKEEWKITEHTLASAGMRILKEFWMKKFGEYFGLTRSNQGNKIYRFFMPELSKEEHEFGNLSYKGGLDYLNDDYADEIYGDGSEEIGTTLDMNGMYSSVMRDEFLPVGKGLYFNSAYKRDKLCEEVRSYREGDWFINDDDIEFEALYIQRFRCSFKLKEDGIPFVSLRSNDLKQWWNREHEIKLPLDEAILDSENQIVELVMTNVDYLNFMRNYDIEDLEIVEGYVYRGMNGLFDDYVNYWSEMKKQATIEGNKSKRLISKLMLNAISGKFGAKITSKWKMVYLKDGVMKYHILKETPSKQEYLPMSAFITSYGRKYLLELIEDIRNIGYDIYDEDVFIYCATDSIHCFLKENDFPNWFKEKYINNVELGYWKLENKIYKSVYLRNKTYLEQKVDNDNMKEEYSDNYKLACSGFPKKQQNIINFDNFKKGKPFKNAKLSPKQVKGGCALILEDFRIKE